MRLSELLHSHVVDEAGHELGPIDDVRLVQDGPQQGAFGAAFRVDGFVVGRGGLGVRLGFHRTGMSAPWALNALFGWLERRAKYFAWDQIESFDGSCVRVRGEPTDVPTD
jgi:hypothetical protein